jgi:hypothetical protein
MIFYNKLIFFNDFNAAYFARLKPYFNAVRVFWSAGQNVFDNAVGKCAAALIFFQNNGDRKPWCDVFSFRAG